jgi:TRAP-type C4-dicarboxylate transport system substrate-binding protein
MKRILGAALAAILAGAAPAVADIDQRNFKVVGTWGNLANWNLHERRFWAQTLPAASGGRLTANPRPYTELGLSGFEAARLLKLGVYDVVHALTSYTSQDSPAMEGIDLAGVLPDFETYRRALNAYRPIIAREVKNKFNAELIMLYPFPSRQLWCWQVLGEVSLASLAGKKIRTHSTSYGDFIEGLGATVVTIAFAEVVPALQRGLADCAIGGTGPAYSGRWNQAFSQHIRVRLGYATAYMAFNGNTWRSLSPETQALIRTNAARLEQEIFAYIAATEQTALDCNAAGPCPWGRPGGMTPIELSAEDQQKVTDIVQHVVLRNWAERCGTWECVNDWNATVGAVAGIEAWLPQ